MELASAQEQQFQAGQAGKPGVARFDFGRRFTQLRAKEDHEWLQELSCSIVRGSGAFPVAGAFAHFFRRVKEGRGGNPVGFPRFKAEGRSRESFTIPDNLKIQNKRIQVPKIGWVRMNRKQESRTQGTDPWGYGEARTAVVHKELNHWYVSVLWKVEDSQWYRNGRVCGVDRNTENVTLSWEGGSKIIPVPKGLIEVSEDRARHYQWRASRRKLFAVKDADGEPVLTKSGKPVRVASHRRQRMQSRAAKAKRKAAGVRKDFSHKVSAFLAQNFEHVVLEDLNVKALRRSARGTREQPGRNVKEIPGCRPPTRPPGS